MTGATVRFLVDATVRDHTGAVTQTFEAGECYDLPDASARRWVRRAMAEIVPAGDLASLQPPDEPPEEEAPVDPDQEPGGEDSSPAPAQPPRRRTRR